MEMQWRSISDLIWINISEYYSCYLANCAYGIITLQIGNLLPHSSSTATLTLHEFMTNFYAWVAGCLVVLMGNGKLRDLWGVLDLKGKKTIFAFKRLRYRYKQHQYFSSLPNSQQAATSSKSLLLLELSEDTAVSPKILCEAKLPWMWQRMCCNSSMETAPAHTASAPFPSLTWIQSTLQVLDGFGNCCFLVSSSWHWWFCCKDPAQLSTCVPAGVVVLQNQAAAKNIFRL